MGKPPATAIYTVGHSNHRFDAFVSLLKRHGVSAVADPLRSLQPFRPALQPAGILRLEERGLGYLFLGRELGGRSDDPAEPPGEGFGGARERLRPRPARRSGDMHEVRPAGVWRSVPRPCATKGVYVPDRHLAAGGRSGA